MRGKISRVSEGRSEICTLVPFLGENGAACDCTQNRSVVRRMEQRTKRPPMLIPVTSERKD